MLFGLDYLHFVIIWWLCSALDRMLGAIWASVGMPRKHPDTISAWWLWTLLDFVWFLVGAFLLLGVWPWFQSHWAA